MRDCENHEASLSALIDDELPSAEKLTVVDHLIQCAACREFYREARALDDLLLEADLPREPAPAPEAVWRRIEARRPERLARPAARSGWRVWLPRAAAFVAVAVGAWALAKMPLGPAVGDRGDIEIVLEQNRGGMNEDRFVEVMREVLQADRRYHEKMLEVMRIVTDSTPGREGPFEGGDSPRMEFATATADGDGGEFTLSKDRS